ncbi:MAG: 3-hydroxyacyl-CoA dehydrogenase NAD-binding domain-containing protein [Actinomycetota bacterium]
MENHAAVIGAGVIGSAWAARFALHGIDVVVSDPNPEAPRILDEVLGNARAAWADLGLPTPVEGAITMADSIGDAVDGAGHVQESAPENPAIKVPILEQIAVACPPDTVIASSTSGIRPSDLQPTITNPERMVVGHPYNPVYLVPVVEVVGGEQTSATAIDTAMATYASISMKPVHVRVEIDAFIGDRLLEAVWREALWLVNDGVATTEEIDDVIRYGFGLRWAQMGLFETYRIAGGEGGMAHFIRQFGPCLEWPWTKLMDVPELTEDLVQAIADQSDDQSGAHSIRELERIRDRNVAGIMRALEANDWGAGTTLKAQRDRLGG